MRNKILNLALAGLVAALSAAPAAAGTIEATFTGVSPSSIFYYTFNNMGLAVHAGPNQWTQAGGAQFGGTTPFFTTFCIELTQNIRPGQTYAYDVMDLALAPGEGMGPGKAGDIGRLWAKYYDQVDDGPDRAAAFQVAIWEILSDSNYLLSGGNFRAKYPDYGPAAIAQGWLNDLSWSGPLPNLLALKSATAQDQVFLAPPGTPENGDPVAVPLPAAVWGGGALLSLLAVRQFRRRLEIPL